MGYNNLEALISLKRTSNAAFLAPIVYTIEEYLPRQALDGFAVGEGGKVSLADRSNWCHSVYGSKYIGFAISKSTGIF